MTLHTPLTHTLRLAVVSLTRVGVVVALAAVVWGVAGIAADAPHAAGLTRVVGDGVDSFTASVMPFVRIPAVSGEGIGRIAITAAGLAALMAVLSVAHVVRGPGDVLMLARHMRHRAAVFTGKKVTLSAWGVVHAAGRPTALASVRLVAQDGTPIAHGVADARGCYGFALTHHDAAQCGARLEVSKGGHWPALHPVTPTAGYGGGIDLAMHAQDSHEYRIHVIPQAIVRLASTGFFWAAMLMTPMAALASPDLLTISALAVTGAVAAVRGTGIHNLV